MDMSGLLRTAAALPLRAVNTAATAAVSSGIALATMPARAAESFGVPPTRRCWRGRGRAWIEVRGLGDTERGRQLGSTVLAAVHEQPGVASAVLNYPLSRLIVTFDGDAPSLRTLCDVVATAEKHTPTPRPQRPIDLPGDATVLAGQLVALTASAAGLCAATAARAARLPRLPVVFPAAVTAIDYQPKVRRLLESRLGPSVTDAALAVASAAAYTAAQSPSSLSVDVLLHLARAAESQSESRAWVDREPKLARNAECRDVYALDRPCPMPPGPIERHSDRAALAQVLGAAAIGAVSRNVNSAATVALVAAPKAARTARESFASTLGRGLADGHNVLPLRSEALRRLDRVDAVLIDPRALSADDLRVSRIRGAAEHERSAVWQWAQSRLDAGALGLGWQRAGGPWATNGHGPSPIDILVRHAHHPLASAIVAEARRSGAEVVSLDIDDLDDLRPMFDDLHPAGNGSIDTALLAAVDTLQRRGATVAVLSTGAPQALSVADVAIGIQLNGGAPPWHADLLVDDLAGAWRVLHAMPGARAASRRGVELAAAGSMLGALLMVPGVRGRGPGPVTAGAAAGLWTGYSLARKALRSPVPPPAATHDWHAMSAEEVRRMLPPPRGEANPPPTTPLTTVGGAVDRVAGPVRRTVVDVTAAMRDELSDPLTPILATGSAASAVLGSPIDAILVGSVLTFNSALAATQHVRAQRLLKRLLDVQIPPARRVFEDETGTRRYADTEAALLRPGDLIEVRSSEVVPADARLIEAEDLEVDESSLTGESLPVAKQVDPTPGATLAERTCMLFATTTVIAGTALAVVTAVGPQTQARRAAEVPHAEGSAVGLQTQLRELTNRAWPISLAGGGLVTGLGLLRRSGLRQAVASGVAVTVAAVPEGLALVSTLAQQASARRLTKLGALVRTPRSVEALGRVDVVCFDKTGTLSENRLRVTTVYPASGSSRDDVVACAAQATPVPDGSGRYAHATDAAIGEAADLLTGPRPGEHMSHLPFRSGRPYSASVSGTELTLKGAPEVVLTACAERDPDIEKMVRRMAADGLRVIAVARRDLSPQQARSACDDPDVFNGLCQGQLRIAGLLGLADTPRPEAFELLTSLAERDIGVRLITGDHPITAAAIATELGIPVAKDQVISGSEWEAMSRRAQEQAVTDRVVFARMSPENKVQIVQTLERLGQVCAMVGDGANDAAAIRAATVGIGVAARGSDPARTAADVMLIDGRIIALLDALDEGRQLWQRVQAAVSVLLGGNAGEVLFAILGSAITGRAPLNTRQLLLVNMLTDALPAAALAVSAPVTATAGRGPDQAALWRTVAVRGVTTAAGATCAWTLASFTGRPRRAATIALVALVATQLGQTLIDSRSPLVVGTAAGSLVVMGGLISTPGVSHLLGSTPLGPVGWAQALGSAAAATAAAAIAPRLLPQRLIDAATAGSGQSTISTTPARHSTAYNSRNGTTKTRATTSVRGSALTPIPEFDTMTTVGKAHDTPTNTP
ncbi:MAG: cation-translocating P-type ATPase [Mycobacteriaceae bacterium]|nr:cation-translocating P-type ATPase [Mycobacteriaceae bacterium]